MSELADSIKRLRENCLPDSIGIQTINQLVELVAEMRTALETASHEIKMTKYELEGNNPKGPYIEKAYITYRLAKAAPIAALKE
jgi:hypothetical protein